MSNVSINIHFDYEGYYSKTGDDYQWFPREANLYGILFRKSSMEEITYSMLVDKICMKIGIDEVSTKLKLSYIPLVVKPQTQSYIFDDEDVYVYLTSTDKEQRRSVLHVEVIKDLEIVPLREQLSRVEKGSSVGVNYGEIVPLDEQLSRVEKGSSVGVKYGEPISSGRADEVNFGVDNLYSSSRPSEQPHEPLEPLENGVYNNIDDQSIDRPDSCGIREYHELPLVVQESQFIESWEDGIGLELGEEFESKQAVQDLVDRASHLKCFGVAIVNSDKNRYVVKCRESLEGCKWYLRVAKLKNSTRFSVRVYTKMHTCSRTTSSTSYKRKCTPRLVASLLHKDFPGQFHTPDPKSLVSLVLGKLAVPVSYSTAYRGKQLAVSDIRGSPEESFKIVYSYLYMLEKVNHGTKTSVVLDEGKRFKYLFVALGASIEGFQVMRKVIVVDATFLKNVYGGVLIFASARDPNHHHYPIAFRCS
ncbi:hypothetical protein V5N11_036428 [Cardamine amara subsp. amara]|uniref:Transposase MuDR plant domain-containing protein n=1 Tax=Cardamine amara subsp. amara TaxID=228776 RepID=A0ABD1A0Y1_CARAN